MKDDFYRAFEDRYRGSRELIKRRLQAYLPFIEPLCEQYPASPALDLRCGRGEWLEILATAGLQPIGIDWNEGMLSSCHDQGLSVIKGEAVAYLSALADNSQAVVSAFHLVEHIDFDDVRRLVSEALRVLKPGGLLIMETPNPENIVVATRDFYLDPTRERPISPELLSFVPEFYGFKRVKTVRLRETEELSPREMLVLQDVLHGVSPDYAVVAQKDADSAMMAFSSMAFDGDYGLTLETLSARYDQAMQLAIRQVGAKAEQGGAQAQQLAQYYMQRQTEADLERRMQLMEAQSVAYEQRAIAAEQATRHWQQQADQWHERLLFLHASTSWKITKPLRAIKRFFTGDLAAFNRTIVAVKLRAKKALRPLLSSSIKYVFKRPALRKILSSRLKYFPRVYQRLLRVAVNSGVVDGDREYCSPITSCSAQSSSFPELHSMTRRTRQVYLELEAAIENKNRERA